MVTKCDQCIAPAVRHVQCGLLIAEALAVRANIDSIQYAAKDFNLCHRHLRDANATYVHYTESDLDQS